MATAAAKKTTRRAIASATSIPDSGDIVEGTEADNISLASDPGAEEETVTVVVPKKYHLTRDDGALVSFEAGTQEMRLSDAAHWWSRAQGVKVYNPEA